MFLLSTALVTALVAGDTARTVSAREMYIACKQVADSTQRYTSADSALARFCDLPLPDDGLRIRDASALYRWHRSEVPSASAILQRVYGAVPTVVPPRQAAPPHVPALDDLLGLLYDAGTSAGALSRDPELFAQVRRSIDSTAAAVAGDVRAHHEPLVPSFDTLRARLAKVRVPGELPALAEGFVAVRDSLEPQVAMAVPPPPPPPPPPPSQFFSLPGSAALGATPAGLQSELLWATSDAVVAKSQEQFKSYLLLRAVRSMCAPGQVYSTWLVESCRALDPKLLQDAPMNTTLLRAALARDAQRLPTAVFEQAVMRSASTMTTTQLVAAGALLGITQMYADVTSGTQPLVALVRLREPVYRLTGWRQAAAESQLARGLYELSGVLATVVDTTTGAVITWKDIPDSLRYPVLAFTVNVKLDRTYPVDDQPIDRVRPRTEPTGIYALVARGQAVSRQLRDAQGKYATAAASFAGLGVDSGAARGAVIAASNDVVTAAVALLQAAGTTPPPPMIEATRAVGRIAVNTRVRDFNAVWPDLLLLTHLGADSGQAFYMAPRDLRVLTLATEVAQARTGDEVDAAVSHFIAGGDSYMKKRSTDRGWIATLNAYGGGQSGVELAGGKGAAFAAPYLPLGIEIGLPRPVHLVGPLNWVAGHADLFLQVLDLGALASWRLSHDVSDPRPQVSVAQVFAPGAYIVFPLGDLPLSVGAGWSWSPQLRKLDRAGAVVKRDAFRVPGIFLGFDVPLFP